jgi:hypothetical protein
MSSSSSSSQNSSSSGRLAWARVSTPASDSRDRPRAFRSLENQLTEERTSRRAIELLFDPGAKETAAGRTGGLGVPSNRPAAL